MIGRRKTYRRVESVLLSDKLGAPLSATKVIEEDVKNTLEKYMKVYDMYVRFAKSDDGYYHIKVDAKVDDIVAPYVTK